MKRRCLSLLKLWFRDWMMPLKNWIPVTEKVQPVTDPQNEGRKIQRIFEEHEKEFMVLTWPSNVPDLRLIKHLWDVLDKHV